MMYHKTVLKNGVRIISEQLDHMQSVSLGIWVNTGSRDESRSENGVSHFIEHMSFKGTETRNALQIAKELDAIGGLTNAFTGKENTCFHARVLGRHFSVLSDILSDIFLNSTFDLMDMERERQVILQEISMVEDSPDENLHELFNSLFWIDHPIGMPILGTAETVSSIDRETILKHICRFYTPERILVVAAGNVEHRSMVSIFEPFFESLESNNVDSNRSVPHSNSGVSVNFRDIEQVHICLGGNAPSLANEKRFACAIFNTILGGNMSSRLFQEVRENRGLAYSVYSFLSSYVDAGLLGVYAATDPGHVNQVLKSIQTEIIKIKRGEIGAPDLASAVDYLIGSIYLSSENSESRMMRIAKNELVFGRYVPYEEVVSDLKRVTVDEVVEVAHDVFQDSSLSVATLGPFSEEDLDRGCIRFD